MGVVYIGDLLTFHAFEEWGWNRGYSEWLKKWIEPQWLAWLIFLLEESPDDPKLFPHGKWATVQVMRQKLCNAAREENDGNSSKHAASNQS